MTKRLTCIAILAAAAQLVAQPQGAKTYATPDEARDAVIKDFEQCKRRSVRRAIRHE